MQELTALHRATWPLPTSHYVWGGGGGFTKARKGQCTIPGPGTAPTPDG